MPRIGINATILEPGRVGGGETYTRMLIEHLPTVEGDDTFVLFVALDHGFAIDDPRFELVVCDGVAGPREQRVAWMRRNLTARLIEQRLDLVHFPFASGPFDYRGPAVVTQHDTVRYQLPSATSPAAIRERLRIDEHIAAAGWHVIVPSQHEARVYARHVAARVSVVHHGVADAMRVDDPVEPRAGAVWVGFPYRHKNLAVLTAAYASGVDLPPLRLIGAAGHVGNLPSGVTAEPAIAHDALPGVYQHALMLLFPSTCESFGLPALEAMAAGTPVIAADLPVYRELHGDAMRLVDSSSPAAWADAIGQLATDDDLWRRMSHRGREHAAQFTWERCARETVGVYGEAVSRRA
jgi:glycosyltransferase involved in cell wall biosynthesis